MQRKLVLIPVVALVLLLSFTAYTLACPVPEVVSVTPNTGLNNESVNIVITGAKFHKSAYVKLTKSGESDIIATNLNITKTEISCTLDLTGKAAGAWDLVVGNVGSISKKEKPAALTEAFTIKGAVVVKKPEIKPEPEPEPEVKQEEKPVPVDPNQDLKAIYFDFDKSNVRDDQVAILASNVKILKANANLKIVLGGHADDRGAIEYNMKLSSQRAESVKKYLLEKGIEANRIIVYAYGEEYPEVEGQNESAWAHNRRVDISLWEFIPAKEQALK